MSNGFSLISFEIGTSTLIFSSLFIPEETKSSVGSLKVDLIVLVCFTIVLFPSVGVVVFCGLMLSSELFF
jgi:hypothetical protein